MNEIATNLRMENILNVVPVNLPTQAVNSKDIFETELQVIYFEEKEHLRCLIFDRVVVKGMNDFEVNEQKVVKAFHPL